MKDDFILVKEFFEAGGYKVLEQPELNENGTDMYVHGKKKCLKVEIKAARELSNGSWQAGPLEPKQRLNDVVAVVTPNNLVIVENMETFMQGCSSKGYKTYTWLKI